MSISAITAQERLDSRGNPTVQVNLTLTEDGATFRALVPSGASKGDYEAVELRDGDSTRFYGNGVLKAVHNVNDVLAPAIINGTKDKSHMGANAILGISMAAARAGAHARKLPLYKFLAEEKNRGLEQSSAPQEGFVMPVPFMNVLNGGDHSGNALAMQEFMIAPVHAQSFAEAVRWNAETYASLESVIGSRYGKSATGLGDEGGFAPPSISRAEEALDLLVEAIVKAGHEGKIKIGIDPAAQSFFRDGGKYDLGFKAEKEDVKSAAEMAQVHHDLLSRYPIVLLEDPFGQDDWDAFASFNKDCKIELVGDDLLATNLERIQMALDHKACNSLLLKINQIGTISEAIEAANKAFSSGWSVFVSHRSGETTDDFIADLTVGLRTGHLKSGAPARGERVAKYNRLLDIEDELRASGVAYRYAGERYRTVMSD